MAATMKFLVALDHTDSSFETFQFYLDKFDRPDYAIYVYHIAIKPAPATGHSKAKKDQQNKQEYEEGIEDLRARCKQAVKKAGHGISQNYYFDVVERDHDNAKPHQVVNLLLEQIDKKLIDMIIIGCGKGGHLEPRDHMKSRAISDQVVNRTKSIALVMTPDQRTNFVYYPTHSQHVARLKP